MDKVIKRRDALMDTSWVCSGPLRALKGLYFDIPAPSDQDLKILDLHVQKSEWELFEKELGMNKNASQREGHISAAYKLYANNPTQATRNCNDTIGKLSPHVKTLPEKGAEQISGDLQAWVDDGEERVVIGDGLISESNLLSYFHSVAEEPALARKPACSPPESSAATALPVHKEQWQQETKEEEQGSWVDQVILLLERKMSMGLARGGIT